MPLIHLVYVSSAVKKLSPAELVALLEISRGNNHALGITGLLLYRDGNFIQVLEGEENDVVTTHERIAHDERHHGLITMLQGPIDARSFSEWSMGFRNLDDADARAVDGYSDFLKGDPAAMPTTARRSMSLMLLDIFRKDMR